MDSFEKFLEEKCPSERHTNNSPEGFERWLEEQDVANIMDYAEEYGRERYNKGRDDFRLELKPDWDKLKASLDLMKELCQQKKN